MSVEPHDGAEAPVNLSLHGGPPPLDAPSSARRKASPIPVATPPPPRPPAPASGPRPKLKPDAEEAGPEEEVLPPSALKGWATSVALHAVFLIMMALWFFSPNLNPPKVIDTRIAGSPMGDETGDQLKGGLGMDTPLNMPQSEASPLESIPTITSLPANQLNLDPSMARPKNAADSSTGGGVNISNPGQAGSGDGFGVARFGSGGEKVNGVEVKVGDPQFTLIWDGKADLDLHVLEPGGSHIYWEDRNGARGGELDVDDVDGYGPENVYWGGGLDKGDGPPGDYKWYVEYYGGLGGQAAPTRWKMRLKQDGKVTVFKGTLTFISEKSRTYVFTKAGPGGPAGSAEKPDEPAGKK